MDPVTINLPDLTQFGPLGYLAGHLMAAMFFGVLTWRQIGAAGVCYGKSCSDTNLDAQNQEQKQQREIGWEMGDAHVARSIVGGIIGIVNIIVVICMSVQMFSQALERADLAAIAALQISFAKQDMEMTEIKAGTAELRVGIAALESELFAQVVKNDR